MTAHRAGDFAEAIRIQSAEVEKQLRSGEKAVDSRKLLSLFHHSAGENDKALELLSEIHQLEPGEAEILENMGVVQRLLGKLDEAVKSLEAAFALNPRQSNICDALAHCYHSLKDTAQTQRFGRLSLQLKDETAAQQPILKAVPEGVPPTFENDQPAKNIISFSLWGSNPRYLKGALRNARLAWDIYPSWTCRFYCDDSVPAGVLRQLKKLGAEVVMRPRPESFFDGLLWRFEVIDDPEVTRYLVRDCDSVINVRERVAVDQWLRSDRWFHCMRDYPSHTEVILAGMWGGVSGALASLEEIKTAFHPDTAPTRTVDQILLRQVVWPMVRQSVLIHDSVYTGCLGSVPFPEFGELPGDQHVGQNEAAVRPEVPMDASLDEMRQQREVVVVSGLDEEATCLCSTLLEMIEGVISPEKADMNVLRRQAMEFAENCVEEEAQPDLARQTLVSAVRAVAEAHGSESKQVAFRGSASDLYEISNFCAKEGFRLLCVLRDPRDTASSRRYTQVSDCEELAETWVRQLKALGKINYARPGSVEIVRYEDLNPERLSKTMGRLARYLERPSKVRVILEAPEIDSGKPLPRQLKKVIERIAGSYLEKLRYPPSEKTES
ncbi:MAG: hypothetical protein AAGA96_20170 [Verrucomicrobiota bacterium]